MGRGWNGSRLVMGNGGEGGMGKEGKGRGDGRGKGRTSVPSIKNL